MKSGLTLDQFKEIVEFAQTYHQFGRYYDDIERAGIELLYPKWKSLQIKYIDSTYDSRDQRIWLIIFRGMGRNRAFDIRDFDKIPELFFDSIMAYLKGEIE